MAQRNKKTKTRNIRKLQELDLIDDFLFQEVVANPDTGEEFCRILLRVILGKEIRKVKVVPQRNILGSDTDRHGIRLDAYIEDVSHDEIMGDRDMLDARITKDIYDFEPDKVYEKNALPRKVRYYHGLIDTKLLETGTDYEELPNVFIIMILPYDPFDKNRMVYTIKNQCVEDRSVTYEDGAIKMFLYTKGTQGNPRQELKDMLQYIEKSVEDNIVNQDIDIVHAMVQHIKQNREVGINYMKSWEWERYITKKATEEGKKEGWADGRFSLLCEMVQSGEISLEQASKKYNMLPEIFSEKMKEAGYEIIRI